MDVLTEKAGELSEDGQTPFSLEPYSGYYKRTAQEGWNGSQDFDLTIGYKNGFLYDIDTDYGYGPGQTGWQNEFFSSNTRMVPLSSREVIEAVPDTADSQKQIGLYGLDGTFYPIKPVRN